MDWIKGIIKQLMRKRFHGQLIISFQEGSISTAYVHRTIKPGDSLEL